MPKYNPNDDIEDIKEPVNERKFQKTSGPKVQNPYEADESWFWPLTLVIAAFLPIVFCLCRSW